MRPAIRRSHPSSVPAVQRRELWSWAMFDFANSGYTTVVITAVFNAYFVGVIAGGADWGTLAWTLVLSASYLLIMLSAPLLGAWADLRARKKSLLVASTVICVAGTAGLAWCGPGSLWLAMLLIVISNTAYGTGENVIAAFLPELAHEDAMGRLSGYGWALGYVGGLLVLGACLWWITGAAARGASTDEAVAQSMLITAAAFLLAALPTLLLLRERAVAQTLPPGAVRREAWARVRSAIDGSAGLIDLRRFLWCIVSYQAGVATVITIAAIFTSEALGFSTAESIQLILLVNITAAIGAFFFGWIQDRLGHRPTLAISLIGWLLAIGLFFIADGRALIWIAANVAGLCLGASQSAGRGLVGYLCPPHREAEIFGLWGLAVKLAMIIGPVSYGLVSWLSGNDHRLAMLSTTAFFVLGLLLLLRVDVARGRRAALAQAPLPA
jgi:UMF1 family MFS transporter